MKSLVEIAKDTEKPKITRFIYNEDILDLCLAWINNEISSNQFTVAINTIETVKKTTGGGHLYKIAVILRKAAANNDIKIIKQK